MPDRPDPESFLATHTLANGGLKNQTTFTTPGNIDNVTYTE